MEEDYPDLYSVLLADNFLCSFAMRTPRNIQIKIRTKLTIAKFSTLKARNVTPKKTSAADNTSPDRWKNVFVTAWALYFSSLVVMRNKECRVVFMSE